MTNGSGTSQAKACVVATSKSAGLILVCLAAALPPFIVATVALEPETLLGPPKILFQLKATAQVAASMAELIQAVETVAGAKEVFETRHHGAPAIVVVGPTLQSSDIEKTIRQNGHSVTLRVIGDFISPEVATRSLNARVLTLPLFLTTQSIAMIVVAAFVRRRWFSRDLVPNWRVPKSIATGALLGLAALGATFVIWSLLAAFGFEMKEQAWVETLKGDFHRALVWSPGMVILGPLGEELLFRGVLVPLHRKSVGATAAWILPALWFAVMHFNPTAIPVYFVLGLIFAFGYVRSGSLIVPFVAHAVYNALAMGITVLS